MVKNVVPSKYFYNVKSDEKVFLRILQRSGRKKQDVHVQTEESLRFSDRQPDIVTGYPINTASSTPETSMRGTRRLIDWNVDFRSDFVFSVTDQMIRLVFHFCEL